MVVIKLGGSLAGSGDLHALLDCIASARGRRVVVVPGGGPFADAVRAAQAVHGFGDDSAHRMALLAMEQFGLMLCALNPHLAAWRSNTELRRILDEGRVPVWLPSAMAAHDASIAATWDVTSDSLAVWLAIRLGCRRLILVKSCAIPEPPYDASALVATGVVDRAFPFWLRRWDGALTLRSVEDRAGLQADLCAVPEQAGLDDGSGTAEGRTDGM